MIVLLVLHLTDGSRSVFRALRYAAGGIVASVGWSATGERLSDAAARELARRDADAADALYAELDALIREHLPRCE